MARSVRPLNSSRALIGARPNSSASAASRAALPAPPLETRVPSMSKRQTCMNDLAREGSGLDARPENFQETGQPLRVRRPGRRGHEVAVDVRRVRLKLDILAAG